MPYAPGISYDSRPLLEGINQGISGLADGIIQRAQERKQKEQMAKAVETLNPLINKMAPGLGVQLDKDTPKEAIPQVIALAGQIEQAQREAPLRALQVENEQLKRRISQKELDDAATNAAALQSAAPFLDPNRVELPDYSTIRANLDAGKSLPDPVRGPNYAGAIGAYVGKGGMSPQVLAQLGDLAQTQTKGLANRVPQGLTNFGTDASGRPVQGLVDAQGNVRYLEPPKSEQPTAVPFQIGGSTLYKVGSDILDGDGKPIKADTVKPLDPWAAQALYTRYQSLVQEGTPDAKAGFGESAEEAKQRTQAVRNQANYLAGQLGFKPPFADMEGQADSAAKSGKSTTPAAQAVSPWMPAIQPAPAVEPSAAIAAPAGKPASPYTTQEIAEELKRRGLVK
jgi:hypothetical protein